MPLKIQDSDRTNGEDRLDSNSTVDLEADLSFHLGHLPTGHGTYPPDDSGAYELGL